jgi:hypothetical protein
MINEQIISMEEPSSSGSREEDLLQISKAQEYLEQNIKQASIIRQLPKTIYRCVELMETDDEKMMAMYSAITVTGALMPNVWFNYDNKRTYVQIMVVIVYPPASGKGKVALFNVLMKKINAEQRESNNKLLRNYNAKMKAYYKSVKNNDYADIPEKPTLKLITIPGNVSSAKLIEQLAENNGQMSALTIETEIDGFTNMLKSQFGSDNGMIHRKLFHNENISIMRKNNNEHLEAINPKMAILLTGTPVQISSLFRNNRDGLNSRFTVVSGEGSLNWKNVQPCDSCIPLDIEFENIGKTYYAIYHHFKDRSIEIKFSDEQWTVCNELGDNLLKRCVKESDEFAGIAKRHINMLARIASTLTMLRYFEENQTQDVVYCSAIDFKTAIWLINQSFEAAINMFIHLPGEPKSDDRSDEFFELIPEQFKRKEISPLKDDLGVSDKWIDRMLVKLVNQGRLLKLSHGKYEKVALSVLS